MLAPYYRHDSKSERLLNCLRLTTFDCPLCKVQSHSAPQLCSSSCRTKKQVCTFHTLLARYILALTCARRDLLFRWLLNTCSSSLRSNLRSKSNHLRDMMMVMSTVDSISIFRIGYRPAQNSSAPSRQRQAVTSADQSFETLVLPGMADCS